METALVLSADRYEFTDEKTGELRRGVTLQYVTEYREDTQTSVGFKPIKAPATPEVFEAVKKGGAPAVYRLHSRTRPGNRKAGLRSASSTLSTSRRSRSSRRASSRRRWKGCG